MCISHQSFENIARGPGNKKTPNKTPSLESGTERLEYSRLLSLCLTHLLSDATVLIGINVMATIITPANATEIKNIDFKYYNLYAREVLFNAKVI